MTSSEHKTHIDTVYEVSTKVNSDLYVVICGDEPLIEPEVISSVIPKVKIDINSIYVSNLIRNFEDPVEVIDPSNIKVVSSNSGNIVMLSRSPIPYPYKSIIFKYKKLIGVECFNKKALDFFHRTTIGTLEKIEDVTLQRFLENNIIIHTNLVESSSLSVDTPNDLEKVKMILKNRGITHE